jgi:hypothetical protein
MMNERKNLIKSVDRSARVYDHSGLASVGRDEAKGTIEMDASFLVDGDPIGSGFGECRDEFVRPFNHKVTVERHPGDLAERSYNRRSDRNIGDEVAIHDVHVESGRSALHSRLRFRAKPSEVSRKNRGSQFDHTTASLGNMDFIRANINQICTAHLPAVSTRCSGMTYFQMPKFFDDAVANLISSEAAHGPRIILAPDNWQ